MLERRDEIRAEINEIAADIETLEGRLLDLTARVAKERSLTLFPELLPAAGKLDLAREALAPRRRGRDSGGRVEQREEPPIPPGDDMAPPHRRLRGRRSRGGPATDPQAGST